jgi:hypothetical protein
MPLSSDEPLTARFIVDATGEQLRASGWLNATGETMVAVEHSQAFPQNAVKHPAPLQD